MRTIVVGDVHGCLDEFRELLKLVSYSKGSDRLVSLGDLMDRGPDPVGCVRFAREQDAIVLMGNHEEKHLRWRRHETVRALTGKKNPMRPFSPERDAQNKALMDEEIHWMSELPLTYDLGGRFVAAHAGLEPCLPFYAQQKGVVRVRYVDERGKMVGYERGSMEQPENTVYWAEMWEGPESVVYGHARHIEIPRVDSFPGGRCYGIDSGCAFGGRLTAMVLVNGSGPEFAQVDAHEVYFNPNLWDGGI